LAASLDLAASNFAAYKIFQVKKTIAGIQFYFLDGSVAGGVFYAGNFVGKSAISFSLAGARLHDAFYSIGFCNSSKIK
jgi:hypothetical protein